MASSASQQDPEGASSALSSDAGDFVINIIFTPEKCAEEWPFSEIPLFGDLITECKATWPKYDWSKTKAIPAGRRSVDKRPAGIKGLLKFPDDEELDLSPLKDATLKLMAPKLTELESLKSAEAQAARLWAALADRKVRRRGAARVAAPPARHSTNDQYTFGLLRPLPYLPNPERSLRYLERLRDDPGIRTVMRRHQFSVPVLTEMDPSQNTQSSHEGTTRILGLNRNKGEVIELRLRTDAYDGYRDYKTIRKTLCHELAHNVHSDHDAAFWQLTKQIEREVDKADYKSRGRTVGDDEYAPRREEDEVGPGGEEDEIMDHGGWTGGTYVLGGGNAREYDMEIRERIRRAVERRLGSDPEQSLKDADKKKMED